MRLRAISALLAVTLASALGDSSPGPPAGDDSLDLENGCMAAVDFEESLGTGLGMRLKALENGQVVVQNVQPRRAAHRAGVKRGARVLSVGGIPMSGMAMEQVTAAITKEREANEGRVRFEFEAECEREERDGREKLAENVQNAEKVPEKRRDWPRNGQDLTRKEQDVDASGIDLDASGPGDPGREAEKRVGKNGDGDGDGEEKMEFFDEGDDDKFGVDDDDVGGGNGEMMMGELKVKKEDEEKVVAAESSGMNGLEGEEEVEEVEVSEAGNLEGEESAEEICEDSGREGNAGGEVEEDGEDILEETEEEESVTENGGRELEGNDSENKAWPNSVDVFGDDAFKEIKSCESESGFLFYVQVSKCEDKSLGLKVGLKSGENHVDVKALKVAAWAETGVLPGDRIVRLNGINIDSVEALQRGLVEDKKTLRIVFSRPLDAKTWPDKVFVSVESSIPRTTLANLLKETEFGLEVSPPDSDDLQISSTVASGDLLVLFHGSRVLMFSDLLNAAPKNHPQLLFFRGREKKTLSTLSLIDGTCSTPHMRRTRSEPEIEKKERQSEIAEPADNLNEEGTKEEDEAGGIDLEQDTSSQIAQARNEAQKEVKEVTFTSSRGTFSVLVKRCTTAEPLGFRAAKCPEGKLIVKEIQNSIWSSFDVQEGDIIAKVNGQRTLSLSSLKSALESGSAETDIVFERELDKHKSSGRPISFRIVIQADGPTFAENVKISRSDFRIESLSDSFLKSGLKSGDRIVQVFRKTPTSVDRMLEALRSGASQEIVLSIERGVAQVEDEVAFDIEGTCPSSKIEGDDTKIAEAETLQEGTEIVMQDDSHNTDSMKQEDNNELIPQETSLGVTSNQASVQNQEEESFDAPNDESRATKKNPNVHAGNNEDISETLKPVHSYNLDTNALAKEVAKLLVMDPEFLRAIERAVDVAHSRAISSIPAS